MKEWEKQQEDTNPSRETAQYSLENLLHQSQGENHPQPIRLQPSAGKTEEGKGVSSKPIEKNPSRQKQLDVTEKDSVPEPAKKRPAFWKVKNPIQTLRQHWEESNRDEEPDEMERIYGTRSMLHPVDSGEASEKKPLTPEFGYLFEKTDHVQDDSLFSHSPKEEKAPAPSLFFQEKKEEEQSQPVEDADKNPAVSCVQEKNMGKEKEKDQPSISRKIEKNVLPEEGNPLISSLHPVRKGSRPSKKQEALVHEKKPSEPLGKENLKQGTPLKLEKELEKHPAAETPKAQPSIPDKKAESLPHRAKPDKTSVRTEPEPQSKEEKSAHKENSSPDKNTKGTSVPASRYEALFGKAQPAPSKGQKSGPSILEGNNKKHKGEKPLYTVRHRSPLILLEAEEMQEALKDEFEEYHRSQKKEPEMVEPVPAKKKKKPKKEKSPEKKDRFSIFGEKEPEEASGPSPVSPSLPALEDYTSPDDAFSVKADLIDRMRSLILRTVVTGIMSFLGIIATLLFALPIPSLEILHTNAYWYLALNLVLLAISAGVCYVPIKEGGKALLRLKGNSDSAISFAVWVTLIHGIVAFFSSYTYLQKSLSVYGCLATLGLFLNSWGKLIMVRRIYSNFKFVAYPETKHVVKIISDESFAEKLCRGMGLQKSIIAYDKPVGFLSNFLRLSYEPDPSEKLAGKLAPVGVLASFAVAAMALLFSQDIQSTLAALSISACICVPMCCVPAVNLLIRGACKRTLDMGAMLVGYPGVRQFADTNAVILDANQLYPEGSVILHGIKGFSGERIDQAILEAGAVLTKAKVPIASTFDQIIKGKGDLFPKVDSVSYEDEKGVIGWVGGRRVLVGNRKLLEDHGITPPERSFEEQYQQDGRQITYLATAGELRAMFVTSYIPNEKLMAQMRKLESEGICFLIRTNDPNVTAQMVSDHFHVYYRSVRILSDQLSQRLEEEQEEEKTARAYLAIRGKRPAAMQRLLLSCIRVRNKITLSLMLQSIAVVLGFVLTAFLIIASGLAQLGTLEMLIYTLFWILAVLIVPCIHKP